jgi:hypothetical protein
MLLAVHAILDPEDDDEKTSFWEYPLLFSLAAGKSQR